MRRARVLAGAWIGLGLLALACVGDEPAPVAGSSSGGSSSGSTSSGAPPEDAGGSSSGAVAFCAGKTNLVVCADFEGSAPIEELWSGTLEREGGGLIELGTGRARITLPAVAGDDDAGPVRARSAQLTKSFQLDDRPRVHLEFDAKITAADEQPGTMMFARVGVGATGGVRVQRDAEGYALLVSTMVDASQAVASERIGIDDPFAGAAAAHIVLDITLGEQTSGDGAGYIGLSVNGRAKVAMAARTLGYADETLAGELELGLTHSRGATPAYEAYLDNVLLSLER